MKKIIFLLSILIATVAVYAQGTLTFSRALIVNDVAGQEVQTGKVWKVTGVYGFDVVCDLNNRSNCNWSGNNTVHHFASSNFRVNGKVVFSYNNFFAVSNNSCTTSFQVIPAGGQYNDCVSQSNRFGWPNLQPNPNIFPMWLPAGTTLQSGGPNTFVSVLEFDIQ
jgi:hypothetical protein